MTKSIACRISKLRNDNNISIPELADRTSISSEQLKDIESGKSSATMSLLIKIARSLGVRLGTILDGEEHPSPIIIEESGSKSLKQNSTDNKDHLNFFSLAQGKSDRHMEPYIINIAKNCSQPEKMSSHEGEEFLYVISGEVELNYGSEKYNLTQGASVYYDSVVPHYVSSTGESDAQILAVLYAPL